MACAASVTTARSGSGSARRSSSAMVPPSLWPTSTQSLDRERREQPGSTSSASISM
jgi:hypothetical protein